MATTNLVPALAVTDELAAQLLALHRRGQFLDAAKLLPETSTVSRQGSTQDLIVTGRVLHHVGAWRQSRALYLLARRRAPRDLEAAAYAAFNIPRQSLWETWRWINQTSEWENVTAESQSHWLTVKARVAAGFRDFATAEKALAQAQELTPQSAWVYSVRAEVLELADEYEKALECTQQAIHLHPENAPGLVRHSHLLTLLNRDDEALALLRDCCTRFTSVSYYFGLVNLLNELKRSEEALATLDEMTKFDLWADRGCRQWQRDRRADFYSFRGDLAAAIAQTTSSPSKYYQRLRENLSKAPPDGRRVELPVPFVRQKQLTCVPATLCALARYWNKPIPQEKISAEICYDGTPHSAERRWAEKHGWLTREFTLTWDSACALIDRKVPFALTTTFTQSAHMQTVVGYDTRRGTFIVRDPHYRLLADWLATPSLNDHAAHGPRALVLLPPEESARLDGLALPDAGLWDGLFRLQSALHEHRRDIAAKEFSLLEASAPGNQLTLRAQLVLADYDRHTQQTLVTVEALLRLHPKDGHYRLRKVWLLRQLERHREAREVLDAYRQEGDGNSAWLQQITEETLKDRRQADETKKLLRQLLRLGPQAPDFYVLAGREACAALQMETAVELYRLAACLGDLREDLAAHYFSLARCRRQDAAALEFLVWRDERCRACSRAPLLSRMRALEQIGRPGEARRLLEAAVAAYPEDGGVLLTTAEQAAQRGEFAAAQQFLERAKGRVSEIQWLQLSATLCEMQGDLEGSIVLARKALEQSPDNESLLQQLARLVSRKDTVQQAAAVVGEWLARFPRHYGFRGIHLQWLRMASDDKRDGALHDFATQNPDNAWLEREWVLLHMERKEWAAAHEHLNLALALEPNFAFNHYLLGRLWLREGNRPSARTAARQAVHLSVDCDGAVDLLLDSCDTPAEQRIMLQDVLEEIARQVNLGDGIMACGPHVFRLLPRAEQKQVWETLHRERPDLWQCWSRLVNYHVQTQDFDEALRLANQAEERFPLLAGAYWDSYVVYQARGEKTGQKAALERALAAYPRWGAAERELAACLRQEGDLAGARAVLQRGVFHDPLDFLNHGYLAELDLCEHRVDEALAGIERALQLEPNYPWGVQTYIQLQKHTGKTVAALDFFHREITRRPQYFWPVMNRARALAQLNQWTECLAALDEAQRIAPANSEAIELRMQVLYQLGRVQEALDLVNNLQLGYEALSRLRSQAAQIEMKRGEKLRAVELLRAALKDDEDNAEAWRRLAECLIDLGQWTEALPAAQQYVGLLPQAALAHAMLAWTFLKLSRREEAERVFAQALRIDPGYQFAAYQLLLLLLKSPEPKKADDLVAQLQRHPGGDFALRCEVELHAHRFNVTAAWEAFARLAATPVTDAGQFESAWTALCNVPAVRGDRKDLLRRLRALVGQNPNLKTVTGSALAELAKDTGRYYSLRRWGVKHAGQSPAAEEALARAIEICADNKDSWGTWWFVLRHKKLLRASDRLWGSVGYALMTLKWKSRMRTWMKDWPNRKNLKPWMLSNLMLAELTRGDWRQLGLILERTRALAPDHTLSHLLTFSGFVVEDVNGARELLQRYAVTPEPTDRVYYTLLRRLAVTRLRAIAERPGRAERRSLFREYRRCMSEARSAKVRFSWPGRRVVAAIVKAENRPFRKILITLRGWAKTF